MGSSRKKQYNGMSVWNHRGVCIRFVIPVQTRLTAELVLEIKKQECNNSEDEEAEMKKLVQIFRSLICRS